MWPFNKKPEKTPEDIQKEKDDQKTLRENHDFNTGKNTFLINDIFGIFNKSQWYMVNVEGAICWYTIQKAVEAYNIAKPKFPDDKLEIIKIHKATFQSL